MIQGEEKPRKLEPCGACGGEGYLPDLDKPLGGWYQRKKCGYCQGKGWRFAGVLKPLKEPG